MHRTIARRREAAAFLQARWWKTLSNLRGSGKRAAEEARETSLCNGKVERRYLANWVLPCPNKRGRAETQEAKLKPASSEAVWPDRGKESPRTSAGAGASSGPGALSKEGTEGVERGARRNPAGEDRLLKSAKPEEAWHESCEALGLSWCRGRGPFLQGLPKEWPG